MILDTIDNLERYLPQSHLVAEIIRFLHDNDLATMPVGRYMISGEDLYVNVVDSQPRTRQEAIVESHRVMADVQIPVSATETHGYAPVTEGLKHSVPYDKDNDISFYPKLRCTTYFDVCPGQFVMYFPEDGHAPAISDIVFRKAIFKVKL